MGLLVGLVIKKNPPANTGGSRDAGSMGKIPWGRKWQPAPLFLPGESHGRLQYISWQRVKLDYACTPHNLQRANLGIYATVGLCAKF